MGSIGVLALQGAFARHVAALADLDVHAREVRVADDMDGLAGLVIPGGESTTLLHLLDDDLRAAIEQLVESGGGLFGTCAGAILMAARVVPAQPTLSVLDVEVTRNAYGRQRDSFDEPIELDGEPPIDGVFIRAPRIARVGTDVEVLGRRANGEPVLVRQGRHLAATFHPELTDDRRVHARFLCGLTSQATAAG